MKHFFQKYKLNTALVIVGVIVLLFFSIFPVSVYAQAPAEVVTDPGAEAQRGAIKAEEKAESKLLQGLKESVFFAANQALSQFLNTLAYDVASFIASGGKGQQPLFYTQGWGQYLRDTVDGAAGNFLHQLGGDWIGINVCNPSTASLKISLGLGIAETQRPSRPVCNASQIVNNWRTVIRDPNFLDRVNVIFDPEQNDIGIAFSVFGKYYQTTADELLAKTKEREEGGGFKSIVSKISEKIKTPAALVKALGEKRLAELPDEEQRAKVQFGPVVLEAVDTFIQTLAGKLFQRIFVEGLSSGDDGSSSSDGLRQLGQNLADRLRQGLYDPDSGAVRGGREAAQTRFLSFLERSGTQTGPFDILSRLATCISPENPGPEDCVIAPSFRSAIEQELTVREAIDRGLLNGGAPFGTVYSPDSIYQSIPLRTITILRAHSIVPVGWELAAEAIKRFGDNKAVSLNELIASYDNEDSNNKYYRLIDENWVLKVPGHLCRASGFGPQILFEDVVAGSDANNDGDFDDEGDRQPQKVVARAEYCADYQTCIDRAPDGSCRFYGYCTEERRTWDLQGSSCNEQFNTCQTFQTTSGQSVSYLENSLDFNNCGIDNAGCQWYCSWFNEVNDIWTCTANEERVLRECNSSTGCAVGADCVVSEGEQLCIDNVSGVTLTLASACSSGSKWWNGSGCAVGSSCTIAQGGVACGLNSCETLENLLPNPSLEAPGEPGTLAQGWTGTDSYLEFFKRASGQDEQVFSGSVSFRFFSFGGSVNAAGGPNAVPSTQVTLAPGEYTISGQVFNKLNVGEVAIEVSGDVVGGVVRQTSTLKNDWQELSKDFTVIGSGSIRLSLVVSGEQVSGAVWFDHFRISESCLVDPVRLTLSGTSDLNESKIHFDRDVESCDPSSDGCSAFIRTQANLGTNLVRNASFEDWSDPSNFPPGWVQGESWGAGQRIERVTNSPIDLYSLKIINDSGQSSRDVSTMPLPEMKPNTTYRVSFWARSDTDIAPQERLWYSELQSTHVPDNYCSLDPQLNCGGGNAGICAAEGKGTCVRDWQHLTVNGQINLRLSNQWQRFIMDPITTRALGTDFKLGFLNVSTDTVRPLYIDGVQIEEVATGNPIVTNFKNYGAANVIHLRKAPDYLGCTGTSTDPPECANYAQYCSAEEVGCEAYRPVAGGASIPGVVSLSDYCPAECIGYEAYNQSPTFFETQTSLEFFIPRTASQCSAASAGCTEFTNLDEVAAGGEGRAYFQSLRLCELPSDPAAGCQSFFTWQGSDETGFQLKISSLSAENGAPKIAIDDPARWPGAWGNCNGPEDAVTNPFCREFLDINGNAYYRIVDNTISCSTDCHPFRKTALGTDPVVAQADCLASNGRWENGACVYQAIPSQGIACSPAAAGCREYKGNTGANIFTVFNETFEDGAINGWRTGEISSEALSVGGHSLKSQYLATADIANRRVVTSVAQLGAAGATCSDALPVCDEGTTFDCYDQSIRRCLARDAANQVDICGVELGQQFCGLADSVMTEGKTYLLSFWGKAASGNITGVAVDIFSQEGVLSIGQANFGPEWQYFSYGPFEYSGSGAHPSSRLRIMGPGGTEDGTIDFFVDNLQIKEVVAHVYAIKDSWRTPASCDTNPFTTPPTAAPQFMLGCTQYRDSFNRFHNLKSFTSLCSENSVGCEALIDTQNSNSPFSQSFNTDDPVGDITMPADVLVYLTNRSEFACNGAAEGCQAVGLPAFDVEGNVTAYQTSYLINNPDQYDTILCSSEEVSCREYRTDEGFVYFKDPQGRTCQYRSIQQTRQPGWYRSGSTSETPDCPTVAAPIGPDHPKLVNGSGFSALCPSEQSSCTQFVDPTSVIAKNELLNGTFANVVPFDWRQTETGNGITLSQDVSFKGGVVYTLSAEAKVPVSVSLVCPGPTKLSSFDRSMIIVSPFTGDLPLGDTLQANSARFAPSTDAICTVFITGYDSSKTNIKSISLRETDISYVLSNSVDALSCNGVVNPERGCVLFNDRSEVNYKFGEDDATYLDFDADLSGPGVNGGVPVSQCSGACDSNAVLKVRPDRECSQWLSCSSTVTITDPDGTTRNVCLGLSACDELNESGECVRSRLFTEPQNLTFMSGQLDQIQNLSGFTKAGIKWGDDQIAEGYYDYDLMTERGEATTIPNGDFETTEPQSSQPVAWSVASVGNKDWASFKFSVAGEPKFLKQGGSYLKLNAAHRAQSELVDVLGPSVGTAATSSKYIISGWINTLDLGPGPDASGPGASASGAGASAKILLQFGPNGSQNEAFRSLAGNGGCAVPSVPSSDNSFANWLECPGLTKDAGLTWQKVSRELFIPAGIKRVRVALVNYHGSSSCTDTNEGTVCALSGSSFFDDISLKPVLDVNNQESVARSCRLYPERDSLSCRYFKDDRLLIGRSGYCLLPDPANPASCLQWWPIDQIKGEIVDEISGYAGPSPLYQCTEGKLTSDFSTFFVDTGVRSLDDLTGGLPKLQDSEYNLRGDDGKQVVLAACHLFANYDKPKDVSYFGTYKEVGSGERKTVALVGIPFENVNVYLFCARYTPEGSDIDLLSGINEFLDSFGGVLSDFVPDELLIGTPNRPLDAIGVRCQRADTLQTCEYIPVMVIGWGLNNVWGECTEVAQTVTSSGLNKAWASRVQEGSNYRLDDLNYPYEADMAPFGSLQPLVGSPDTWFGKVTADGKQPARFADFDFEAEDYDNSRGIAYNLDFGNLPSVLRSLVGQCSISKTLCMDAAALDFYDVPLCPLASEKCEFIKSVGDPIPTLPGTDQAARTARAREILQQIFARSYGVWYWQASSKSYDRTDVSWDVPTGECSGGVRPSGIVGYCFIKPLVSVQPVVPQTVSGAATVQLNFNVNVDPDQLPLRFYRVDWGDGKVDSVSGVSLRNRFNPEQPFTLNHLYDYRQLLSAVAQGQGNAVCLGNSCTVTISVQVIDNWDIVSEVETITVEVGQ